MDTLRKESSSLWEKNLQQSQPGWGARNTHGWFFGFSTSCGLLKSVLNESGAAQCFESKILGQVSTKYCLHLHLSVSGAVLVTAVFGDFAAWRRMQSAPASCCGLHENSVSNFQDGFLKFLLFIVYRSGAYLCFSISVAGGGAANACLWAASMPFSLQQAASVLPSSVAAQVAPDWFKLWGLIQIQNFLKARKKFLSSCVR